MSAANAVFEFGEGADEVPFRKAVDGRAFDISVSLTFVAVANLTGFVEQSSFLIIVDFGFASSCGEQRPCEGESKEKSDVSTWLQVGLLLDLSVEKECGENHCDIEDREKEEFPRRNWIEGTTDVNNGPAQVDDVHDNG